MSVTGADGLPVFMFVFWLEVELPAPVVGLVVGLVGDVLFVFEDELHAAKASTPITARGMRRFTVTFRLVGGGWAYSYRDK